MSETLERQFAFLTETDRLKSVTRANVLTDGSRQENSAEHSWHVALWALVFADRCAEGVAEALAQVLLHDIVEIDAGDHPIHLPRDEKAIARAESQAAERLFGLLPPGQAETFHTQWRAFEAQTTAEARHAKNCDHTQPVFQDLWNIGFSDTDRDINRRLLTTGRSATLADRWPEAHGHALALLEGHKSQASAEFLQSLRFLAEADQLKGITRASRLIHTGRFENSAEHSWQVALYALVLHQHAAAPVDVSRVIQMLVVHDIVEIDAGDNPLHGDVDHAAQEAAEQAAADRLFGLLPPTTAATLRGLWDEFEARQTPEARFGKAIDRITTPIQNLAAGGGTWADYDVSFGQIETRVGTPIQDGAPALWDWLSPQIAAHFQSR